MFLKARFRVKTVLFLCFAAGFFATKLLAIGQLVVLNVSSGNGQTGNVSSVLPSSLVVRMLGFDMSGNPVIPLPGRIVDFTVTSPPNASGAAVSIGTAVTGPDGTASTQLMLGNLAGTYQVAVICDAHDTCSALAPAIFTETAVSGGLSSPTNVHATQGGPGGTQIQLSWDYTVTDPIGGFKVERKTPSGTWIELQIGVSQLAGNHWLAVDTQLTPYATYSYRVRAYTGAEISDYSVQANCFQIQKFILPTPSCSSCAMNATFQPDLNAGTAPLSQVAQIFGYDHFDWVSVVENDPNPLSTNKDPLHPLQPPFIDPPAGGYMGDRLTDELPFYWDEQQGFEPNFYYLNHTNLTSLTFEDVPKDPLLQMGQYIGFTTYLVGIGANGVWMPLAAFQWYSNFNGSVGGVGSRSDISPPTTPGTGGVFNVDNLDLQNAPLNTRELLIRAGGQAISTSSKVDTDAPTTIAFLTGVLGTKGWFSGPVIVTLIATDVDGPNDIAGTAYSLDGSSAITYIGPFTISSDGQHVVEFASVDRAGNAESPIPSQMVSIDTIPPAITCVATPQMLWPPNGKPVNVTVKGTMIDATSGTDSSHAAFAVTDEYGQVQPSGPVTLGTGGSYLFVISLIASREGSDKNGRTYTITVTDKDQAGNLGSCSTIVTVPHDQDQ